MSTSNDKKPKYPVMEMADNGRIILPSDILAQITYLHGKVGNKEWSGMLFYDVVSGSPAKPKDFVLKATHIYLMDIGSGAATEYEADGDFVDLYDAKEEAMEWKIGHIHTHHNMSAHFSATDMSELNDNVDKHNYYLSLVVNFDGRYDCKVAFLSDVHSSSKMNYVDDAGKIQHFKTDHVGKQMVTIDMDIYYEYNEDIFYSRYNQVIEKAKKAAKAENKYNYNKHKYKGNNSALSNEEFLGLPPGGVRKDDDVDPKEMKDEHVEKLARNVFSVTSDLSERRSVYQILILLGNSRSDELEFYYQWLADNIEDIIGGYFDQELEPDEMAVVIEELKGTLLRFSGVPSIKRVADGITEVMQEFFTHYVKTCEEKDQEEQLENEALETEIELLNT